jgi:hypothetical protein
VPKEAHWSYLKANAPQPAIGTLVDDAMAAIERDNPSLKRERWVAGTVSYSRLLRHDLAVFPHVDRRAMHPGGLARDLGGSPECTSDSLGKGTGGLFLSARHGAVLFALSACHWLLVSHFNLKSKILNHAPDFWGRLAWCREVAVHEDGVGWIEGEGLETAQIVFAASGHAEFGAWVQESEQAEYF